MKFGNVAAPCREISTDLETVDHTSCINKYWLKIALRLPLNWSKK